MLTLILFTLATLLEARTTRSHLEPIVLVPGMHFTFLHLLLLISGLGGSRLQYKENDDDSWKVLWISLSNFNPFVYEKWVKRMAPIYDPDTDTYNNIDGLQTGPIDFGGVDGIYTLDPELGSLIPYFNKLIDALKDVGYEVGINMFGAPV